MTRSEFAERFLYLNGRQLSLSDYPFLRQVYDEVAQKTVLKFSRQTAKSTTMANIMITNSAMTSYYKTMYVAPTVDQTKVFSHDRVAPVLESSPLIKDFYMSTALVQNVHMKQLLNHSKMYLRYALLSGDKLRGYSSDEIFFDECQDLKSDIIPVAEEAMSRSLVKRSIYSGTPKRSKGTLADFWFRSTQNEYMLRCNACNKWNLLDEDNIGDFYLICKKCGRELDPGTSRGEWVSTFPQSVHGPDMVGYRVCLLHFAKAPWVDWNRDIIVKRRNQTTALFHNETLGLEYDTGVSPITRTELYNACQIGVPMNTEPDRLERSYQSIMGIDYGPVNSENSHTVISIIQMRGDNKYHVVYAKKFMGKEADYSFIHEEIPRLMAKWNCTHLAADYGMGEAPNSEIRSRIGYQKVIAFQHMASQKKRINWNKDMPAYTMNRNQVMTEVFDHIRKGKLLFPQLSDVEHCIEDILNIQTEFNEELGRMKFTNLGPDDFFHATLFAILANQMLYSVNSV